MVIDMQPYSVFLRRLRSIIRTCMTRYSTMVDLKLFHQSSIRPLNDKRLVVFCHAWMVDKLTPLRMKFDSDCLC